MTNHAQIVELSKRIQIISQEIEQRQEQLERLVEELHAATRAGPARLGVTTTVVRVPRSSAGRKVRSDQQNSLPIRITELLAAFPNQGFKARDIFEKLALDASKKPQLNVTLSRLFKEGRVKRDDNGYRTALGSEPIVRRQAERVSS